MERTVRKIGRIFKGWFKVLTFQDSKEAKRKRTICSECDRKKFKLNWFGSWFLAVCMECGCPIVAKSRSGDDCPLKKW